MSLSQPPSCLKSGGWPLCGRDTLNCKEIKPPTHTCILTYAHQFHEIIPEPPTHLSPGFIRTCYNYTNTEYIIDVLDCWCSKKSLLHTSPVTPEEFPRRCRNCTSKCGSHHLKPQNKEKHRRTCSADVKLIWLGRFSNSPS